MNKVSLCIHFTGNPYYALVPFLNNPQKFKPKHVIINITLLNEGRFHKLIKIID